MSDLATALQKRFNLRIGEAAYAVAFGPYRRWDDDVPKFDADTYDPGEAVRLYNEAVAKYHWTYEGIERNMKRVLCNPTIGSNKRRQIEIVLGYVSEWNNSGLWSRITDFALGFEAANAGSLICTDDLAIVSNLLAAVDYSTLSDATLYAIKTDLGDDVWRCAPKALSDLFEEIDAENDSVAEKSE